MEVLLFLPTNLHCCSPELTSKLVSRENEREKAEKGRERRKGRGGREKKKKKKRKGFITYVPFCLKGKDC